MIIRPGHIFETVNLVGHRARDRLKSLWNIFLQDTTRTKKVWSATKLLSSYSFERFQHLRVQHGITLLLDMRVSLISGFNEPHN